MRWLVAFLVAGSFLWSDVSWALPERVPVAEDCIQEADAQQVARRRRKRKRRKKKKKPNVALQPAPAPGNREVIPIGPGGRTRIEFMTGSSIFGQTTQPGEVCILERKDTELKSMVMRRTGFQKEIIQTVFHDYSR